MTENRDLPSSHKAEQALLGIILLDHQAFERIPPFFKPEHMHDQVHARLCEAIFKDLNGGGSADPIALQERFSNDQAFQAMGGFTYLADLVDHAPSSVSAGDFCHLISDLALRRATIRLAEQAISDAYENRADPMLSIVDELSRQLDDFARFREESGPVAFSDAVSRAVEQAASAIDREGGLAGLSTGLMDLDRKLRGLRPTNLIVLAARPSMGKTALATNIAFYTARRFEAEIAEDGTIRAKQGGVVAFFSLEMSEEELATRILAEVAGINGERIQSGELDVSEFGRLVDAAQEIQGAPLYIDATGAISIHALATRCRRLKRMVGLDLVVVDYLQLVTVAGDSNMNPTLRISIVTQALKALAKELGVPVVALSQLSRQVDSRPDKKPLLSDLRESGSIEQDADVVIFVYREHYYLERAAPKEGTTEHMKWEEEMDACKHQADIIIGKQRHGSIGTVKVGFKGETTKFSDLAREERA